MMSDALLYFFSGTVVLAGLTMLITRNVMYAAFALVVVLIGLAGIYVLNFAEFVAVAQLMIYVGGVIVLLLFAIMLTQKTKGKVLLTGTSKIILAVVLSACFFGSLLYLLYDFPAPETMNMLSGFPDSFGITLLTEFLVPLELAGIILLVVLIGASTIAGDYFELKGGKQE